jgi:hypothetical protein
MSARLARRGIPLLVLGVLAAGCGVRSADATTSQSPAGSPTGLAASTPDPTAVQPQPPPRSCHARGSGLFSLPDRRCTPGAVDGSVTQANIDETICRAGYTRTVRPPESITKREKQAGLAAYGDTGPAHHYEYDHLVALELGGAPNDPRNRGRSRERALIPRMSSRGDCGGRSAPASSASEPPRQRSPATGSPRITATSAGRRRRPAPSAREVVDRARTVQSRHVDEEWPFGIRRRRRVNRRSRNGWRGAGDRRAADRAIRPGLVHQRFHLRLRSRAPVGGPGARNCVRCLTTGRSPSSPGPIAALVMRCVASSPGMATRWCSAADRGPAWSSMIETPILGSQTI